MARLASKGAAGPERIPVGGDEMDTSETIDGKRERAPVEGAMGWDIPSQSLGRTCRVGDLHLVFVADKEAVTEHAKWWHFETMEKVDSQSGKVPSAPFVIVRGGSALSA